MLMKLSEPSQHSCQEGMHSRATRDGRPIAKLWIFKCHTLGVCNTVCKNAAELQFSEVIPRAV